MNDHSPPAMGHNNPPADLPAWRAVLDPYRAWIDEAELWLDGVPVDSEQQLEAVDAILAQVKSAEKALSSARDVATRPLHDAWKAEVAIWKEPHDMLERLKKGLARIANDFKVRLLELREAEAQRLHFEAEARVRVANDLAKQIDPGNIHSVHVADQARREAEEALRARRFVEKTRPKGLRTVHKWAFIDGDGRRQALHWIARNDREAVTEFIEGYVARNFRANPIDGVRVWQEKEAY